MMKSSHVFWIESPAVSIFPASLGANALYCRYVKNMYVYIYIHTHKSVGYVYIYTTADVLQPRENI